MTAPEKEIFDVPEIIYCSSAHAQYFTLALYVVKGVLLTFGLFLAWETRNICISQLNDSKYCKEILCPAGSGRDCSLLTRLGPFS